MSEIPAAVRAAQRGLVDNPRHGTFVTVRLTGDGDKARARYLAAVRALGKAAGKAERTYVVTAVSPELAAAWFGEAPPGAPPADSVITRSKPFADTGGDVWFYLKSADERTCRDLAARVVRDLGDLVKSAEETAARQEHDRKILGDHFYDGLTSPADPASVAAWIVRDGPAGWVGGCWLLTQRFLVDWDAFGPLPPDQRDDVIGRDGAGVLLPIDDLRSHIKRARVFTPDRGTHELLRLSLPFGRAASGAGRELGIYFVAFANDAAVIERSLRQLTGEVATDGTPGNVPLTDKLMGYVTADEGGYWYVPSAKQLRLGAGLGTDEFRVDEHWAVRSANGLMFYNTPDYLNVMGAGGYQPGDGPSTRILGLLGRIVERWQANWYEVRVSPRVPHLREFLGPDERHLLDAPVAVRKGLAVNRALTRVVTNEEFPQTPDLYAWQADLFRVDPEDVLAGVMPELSLGRGKEVMPYLREDERIPAFLLTLDESSAMGHVVPRHAVVLERGLGALVADAAERRDAATEDARRAFYASVVLALEGVQGYCRNYALLAERTAATLPKTRRANLLAIADRMRRLATEPPRSFVDAAQSVLTMHCCLHLTGDPVSVGRLDQLLQPFLDADSLSDAEAQEVIDAFWIKLAEKATHNRHAITDTVSYGTTAVSYVGGNFPQGGGINQWVQQLTVGGYLPTGGRRPKPGANRVTLLCLRAARRLPLNAPCLSLRLYPGIGDEYVEEAARALLSGGAHPILFNEERMVRGLHEYSGFPLERARDYACDGCYEPMIAGASEFAFSNVAPLDALELTLNEGAKWGMAGPEYLRGWKVTFRSPKAADIASFDELRAIYATHLEWLVVQFFNGVLVNYGNVAKVCPDPLLSSVIEGCVESGRDLTAGGAAFHIVAPMFVGLATTIDSLYAIKKLVFDPETAVTTLPELLLALQADWGFAPQEPFESTLAGPVRTAATAERYQDLRAAALALPRFGSGHPEVDEVGHWLLDTICSVTDRVFTDPPEPLASVIDGIVKAYSLPDRPFRFHLQIGVGTFEGYVGDGLGSGASADGRRNAQPYPSDLSPSPVPQDLPPVPQNDADPPPMPGAYRPLYPSLRSWDVDTVNGRFTNAAPVDLNVREDFPLADLTRFVRDYAEGRVAGNLLTVTCADPDTYAAAAADPERYELVRVRMGGWTEYFSAMFPGHQMQHQRRPFFLPG